MLDLLAAEPMRLVEIAQSTGREVRPMSMFLDGMVRKGLIVRVAYGCYWLADPQADAMRMPEAEVYEGLSPAEVARLKRIAALQYG